MWKSASLCPDGKRVLTKIDDGKGERNVGHLTKRGRLWFTNGPNEMYVYYTPTHFWQEN